MELSRCKGRIKEFVTLEKKFIRRWAGERGGVFDIPSFDADCLKPGVAFLASEQNMFWMEVCLFYCIDVMGMTKMLPLPR